MLYFREELFTTLDEHTMWIGTWNVNGSINEEEVEKWIRNTTASSVDVYVLGLEEMVPLTALSILFHSGVDSRKRVWIELVKRILESIHGCTFQCLASSSMVGLFLSVFVPETKMSLFTHVSSTPLYLLSSVGAIVPTGTIGFTGNKGGIAIRFHLNASSFVFVCSHLSPHIGNVSARNHDYHKYGCNSSFPVGFWMKFRFRMVRLSRRRNA